MMKPVVKTAEQAAIFFLCRDKETGKKLNHLAEPRELFICFVGF
jgi:hypothetical protein